MDSPLRTLTNRLQRKLNRTFMRGVICALSSAMVAVFAMPSSAMAAEDYFEMCTYTWVSCQTGVKVGLPEGVCMTAGSGGHYTQVCIDYDGDYVYVRDGQADGYAGVAYVDSQYGDINGRLCRNNYGYGTWAKCNFDWTEDGYHFVKGCYKVNYTTQWCNFLWDWYDN